MVKIVKNELYKYKDREFNLRLQETPRGFFVFIFDAKTSKRIKLLYKIEHKVVSEIIKKELSSDPVEDIFIQAKNDLNLFVDKNLV